MTLTKPDSASWIQADLGQVRKVTGVVIQGCPNEDHWVTKFKVQHSMDGSTWTAYTADGEVGVRQRWGRGGAGGDLFMEVHGFYP